MPAPESSLFLVLLLLISVTSSGVDGIRLLIVNDCKDTLWPAILGTAGQETPAEGGFVLPSGKQVMVEAPLWWSGRIWARQDCCFDSHGKGWCLTGDCGGLLRCDGAGGRPPATLVEMTLGTPSNPMHFYDVSLVDGFNVPVSVVPVGGSGGCGVAACEADVNACCPKNLTVVGGGRTVGCKSACLATGEGKYCCTGEYASPRTCRPTVYENFFKKMCPRAYSYAFDEPTGLKSCRAKEYVVSFCPPN